MSQILVCSGGDITTTPNIECSGSWVVVEHQTITEFDPVLYDMIWQAILMKFVIGLSIGLVLAMLAKLKR